MTLVCQLHFAAHGAGRPFPSLPKALGVLRCRNRRTSTSEAPLWSTRLRLAAARPEGCEGPSINRGSWSHSMVWWAHETWQMQLQLLLGTEHQPPSLGHMKDPLSLWQYGVKLPFFSWSLPHLWSSKAPAFSSQAKGQTDHVYQGLCIYTKLWSYRRVLLLEFKTSLKLFLKKR